MPKITQAKSATTTLNKSDYQEAIDALQFASNTLDRLGGLLISIEKSDSLKHAQKLADLGSYHASDIANYIDSAREDLAGASL